MKPLLVRSITIVFVTGALAASAAAQGTPAQGTSTEGTSTPHAAPSNGASTGVIVPPGYVVGAEDILSIVFWRDKEMSAEVVVRPDGKISLPLVNDIQAAGYTPEELRVHVEKAASKFIAEPSATVLVKAINSRKVYITGNVGKPGTYPLTGEMTVLQFIALSGGLLEYADSDKIVVIRREAGRDQYFKFNYNEVIRQKQIQQNILLKPGDTVVVR
jgi:polysaccharide export outer membrane protein